MADLSGDISDVEMSPAPETSRTNAVAQQCTQRWLEKMKQGVLSSTHFKEHWRVWVPRIFSPTANESFSDWSYDEEKARKLLFSTLEEFICDGDPAQVLTNMSQLERPPSVCGRVFKVGEPTYSCRECGMDSTCVLCVDCFKQSEHRGHKYKMGTSSGGGCCDCGDTEAWKRAPFCDIHIVGVKDAMNKSNENRSTMPEDMAERVRMAFDAVLWYAYELLSMEHSPRIPADLCTRDTDINMDTDITHSLFDMDTYCTVLYNDETHTFEQVISTLTRVIKCNQKMAIEYVTNIDREGRAVVKCSSFQHCSELKAEIEKYTSRHGNKSLKVLVVHAHVVAHQLYAMKLLAWLQAFLAHGEDFRNLFTEVALKTKPSNMDASIVVGILLRDIHMWKSARTHWHRLLISGMLMEYDSKKSLAKVFTKKYGIVMKDFIRDDHDHSFSVCSLSVQIFTVPTLAHYLIAEEDALFSLLNAFISECNCKCNRNGKLEFERNVSNNTFKRAQYMLYDLRYLLSSVPEKWTDALRKGFLQGLALILSLLTMMQGMDAVSRQVGQHMEYEPEWESAFNLHIKLAYCISLALEWCGTDRVVLIKAYRATLKKLQENPCVGPLHVGEVQEIANHSVACLQYDVSTKPVSIHLPLSRFLAGLHLHLEAHGLNFNSAEFLSTKPNPEEIIEPVLRTQAMIAQVHAGMWRRNGYALLNQLFFYHNVKCRTEMLDRDIILLQMGASIIESNEFLIHILNKFNLTNWAHPDFEKNTLRNVEEDNMRQTISLVEEFLQLLIVIVGERHMPGVGTVTARDRIKKEIIQQLSIKPMPHSELNKTLPDDVSHEMVLDDVIGEVATFKKPTQGSGKGVYELKTELYNQYNVFFYHYTREELSRSEETQRKRRKVAGELECCPPPDLPALTESFSMIVNLLQCDVMLYIMQTVLERSTNLRARSFSEPQLHKVLHLIGYALQEEESRRYPILLFTERAAKWKFVELLEELSTSPRVEAHKDLLTWTLAKFKSVAAIDSSTNTQPLTQTTTTVEPSSSGNSLAELAANEKDRRAKLAAQRRAKIMEQMAAMQNNFMKENAKLFEEATTDQAGTANTEPSCDIQMEIVGEGAEAVQLQPIALGPLQTNRQTVDRTYTCILCQEQQKVSQDGPVLVLAAFVQQATVLCQVKEPITDEHRFMRPAEDHSYLNSNLGPAPHTSTCGHVMHSDCWQKYFDNVVMKEHRRPYRHRHPASFDVEKQEFLCPLCECLSNTVLPLIPSLGSMHPEPSEGARSELSFDKWLAALTYTVTNKTELCHGSFKCKEQASTGRCKCDKLTADVSGEGDNVNDCELTSCNEKSHRKFAPCSLQQAAEQTLTGDCQISCTYTNLFTPEPLEFSERLKDMIDHYALTTYTRGLGVNQNLEDKRVPLLMWQSCAYTIHTMEILLRDSNKPLLGYLSSRQRDCLESLVRIVAVFGSTWKHGATISVHAFHLLRYIVEHSDEGPCILDWDSFGILISLTMALPNLYRRQGEAAPLLTGGTQQLHVFRLIFAAHIVRILIMTDYEQLRASEMDTDEDLQNTTEASERETMLELLRLVGPRAVDIDPSIAWRHVQNASMPFLRCCVLFYRYLTDVCAPAAFSEPGGDTYSAITQYLGIPDTCAGLFETPQLIQLASRWCSHVTIRNDLHQQPYCRLIEPLPIARLVDLPSDYSELINAVSLFTCPNSDREDSRNPTMCLVCGEMLCSQSYCCQIELNKTMVGACTYHAHLCGAGVGVFLRVRECEILFLASPMRGCFVSPPYLDDYGETDQGLRRGNPLHLCYDKYRKLQTLWLSHSIHEEIARAIESSSNLMSTQWQHL